MSPARENREWRERHKRAVKALTSAVEAMDFLSELATEDADMKICFASNTIQGSAALLREADALQRGRIR
jgi:hypothetical protein